MKFETGSVRSRTNAKHRTLLCVRREAAEIGRKRKEGIEENWNIFSSVYGTWVGANLFAYDKEGSGE